MAKRFHLAEFTKTRKVNIIHLFPLHKGDMQICSPEKSHISRGQRPSEMTISRVNKFSYLSYAREMNALFHQANVLVNSAK
jgi:hypothetical protein